MSQSNRYTKNFKAINREMIYSLDEAVKLIKSSSPVKFDETIGLFIAGYFIVLCFDFFFYFKEKIIKTDYFILRLILTAGIAPSHILYIL